MLLISDNLWSQLLDSLSESPVEQVAYLDGLRLGDVGVATTVTFPAATLSAGNYRVGPDAARQASRAVRAHGLTRLAQVHTHPGRDIGHSDVDDDYAYSQASGSISIVLPHHGRKRPDIGEAGVHIRDAQGWRRLKQDDVAVVVRSLPSILDFRPQDAPRRRKVWLWKR